MLIEALALHFAKLISVRVRILRKEVHDVGVVPAAARLGFLGGEHVPRVGNQNIRGFHRTHEARVESYELKLISHLVVYGVQRGIYLVQRKAVVVVVLIEADAADASAAVIPEHESHALCRVVLNAPGNEVRQRIRLPHGSVGKFLHKLEISVHCHPALERAVGNSGILIPLIGAAGLVYDTDIFAVLRGNCLNNVLRAGVSLALEVRAAEVHENRPAAVAHCRIVRTRAAVNLEIAAAHGKLRRAVAESTPGVIVLRAVARLRA